MIQWTLQTIPLKNLKNHQKNPRQITKEQLKHLEELIKKYGLIDKPVVNLDMTIIGGHQRVKLLRKMKVKEVECWVPNAQLSEEEIDRLCIGLNLNQGKWDWDLLANEYEAIDLLKWGFTEEQLVGPFAESEEILDGEPEEKKKKKKCCPNCGHEF